MKLSVCIPTYNRREKVIAQLKRLLSQMASLERDVVEVLVSDNCSTDGTYDSLKSEAFKIPNVRIFCQTHNLGLVGNMYFLFEKAKGDYIWFLSDDDPLLECGLSQLLVLINRAPKDFYLLNFRTDISDELYWNPVNDYLLLLNDKNWGGLGLLSAQVLKKEKFKGFYEGSTETYNLCQPVAVSLYGLLYLDGMVSFESAFVQHHIGDYSWMKDAMRVFSVYLLDSIIMLKKYGNKSEYSRIIRQLKQMEIFCYNSIIYLVRKRDIRFLKALNKEGLLSSVLFKGFKSIIKTIL